MLSKSSIKRFSIEIINQLSILITLPIIIFSIGIESFGVYSKVLIYFQLSFIFLEWGFNLSSLHFSNENEIQFSNVVSSIIYLKIFYLLIILFLLISLSISKKLFLNDENLYALISLIIGGALNPVWYFQAINDYNSFFKIVIFSRVLYLIMVFISLESSNPVFYLLISHSLALFIIGLYGFYKIFSKYSFSELNIKDIKIIFLNSSKFFFQNNLINRVFSLWTFYSLPFLSNYQIGIINLVDTFYRSTINFTNVLTEILFGSIYKIKEKFFFYIFVNFKKIFLLHTLFIVIFLSFFFIFELNNYKYFHIIFITILAGTYLSFSNIIIILLNKNLILKKLTTNILVFFVVLNIVVLNIFYFSSSKNIILLMYHFFFQNFIFFIFVAFYIYFIAAKKIFK